LLSSSLCKIDPARPRESDLPDRFQADGCKERSDRIPIEVKKIASTTSTRVIPLLLGVESNISHSVKIELLTTEIRKLFLFLSITYAQKQRARLNQRSYHLEQMGSNKHLLALLSIFPQGWQIDLYHRGFPNLKWSAGNLFHTDYQRGHSREEIGYPQKSWLWKVIDIYGESVS